MTTHAAVHAAWVCRLWCTAGSKHAPLTQAPSNTAGITSSNQQSREHAAPRASQSSPLAVRLYGDHKSWRLQAQAVICPVQPSRTIDGTSPHAQVPASLKLPRPLAMPQVRSQQQASMPASALLKEVHTILHLAQATCRVGLTLPSLPPSPAPVRYCMMAPSGRLRRRWSASCVSMRERMEARVSGLQAAASAVAGGVWCPACLEVHGHAPGGAAQSAAPDSLQHRQCPQGSSLQAREAPTRRCTPGGLHQGPAGAWQPDAAPGAPARPVSAPQSLCLPTPRCTTGGGAGGGQRCRTAGQAVP